MILQSGPKQGFLGAIKSALELEPAVHPASELPKLFSSQPFTVPEIQPSDLSKTDSLGLDIDLEIGRSISVANSFSRFVCSELICGYPSFLPVLVVIGEVRQA